MQIARNNKDIWEAIKSITETNKQNSVADELLRSSDTAAQDIETVNDFFVRIGTQRANMINNSNTNVSISGYKFNIPMQSNIALLSPDETEIQTIVNNLKNNCATGWDGIPVKLLKLGKPIIVPL